MHYYVYYYKDEHYLFDRTCGTQDAAEKRTAVLQARGHNAVWLLNHVIKDALY
jgi:hypothetical protein